MSLCSQFGWVVSLCVAGLVSGGATTTTTTTTATTTVVTEAVKVEKSVERAPLRVVVMDFQTVATAGHERFLMLNGKPVQVPAAVTLNDQDRDSIHSVMQGFVRMIDAWDGSRTNDANRVVQMADNARFLRQARELYEETARGATRPALIGAEYLRAGLGAHPDVFGIVEQSAVAASMAGLARRADFPADFMLHVARATGATHLVYTTVSDLRSRETRFEGYGVKTENTEFELDLIVRVVDLVAQRSVYSRVYTGSCREQRIVGAATIDGDRFGTLLKAAIAQAAADLYQKSRPGDGNVIAATPLAPPSAEKTIRKGGKE